jgi:hypothetical protein
MARTLNVDRRSVEVTFAQGLARISAAGNEELADEIKALLESRISGPGGGGERGWMSAVEQIARFDSEDQRWAWEQTRARGVRWLKRYIETQNNPPDSDTLAARLVAWIDREYPLVDTAIVLEALVGLAEALEASRGRPDQKGV